MAVLVGVIPCLFIGYGRRHDVAPEEASGVFHGLAADKSAGNIDVFPSVIIKIHKNTTTSRVEKLDMPERIEETARMLGGLEMTEQSLSHAKEMIERAHTAKKKTTKKSRQSA